jgi:hypothetical protein
VLAAAEHLGAADEISAGPVGEGNLPSRWPDIVAAHVTGQDDENAGVELPLTEYLLAGTEFQGGRGRLQSTPFVSTEARKEIRRPDVVDFGAPEIERRQASGSAFEDCRGQTLLQLHLRASHPQDLGRFGPVATDASLTGKGP